MKDFEKLKENFGELVEFTTPSGNTVVLRQQNGEDDEVISNAFNVNKGIAMSAFLSNLIVDSSYTEKGIMSVADIMKLRVADAYFMVIASRIFSLGQLLSFEYKWDDLVLPQTYEEDLGLFIWDYSKPFPFNSDDIGFFKYRIKPINTELVREIHINPKDRVIRYSFMTVGIEQDLLKVPDEKQSKNQELLVRNIEEKVNGTWVKVENFRFFSSYEMAQIRNDVSKNDPMLDLYSDIKHPIKNNTVLYPIFGSPDFFFPRVI